MPRWLGFVIVGIVAAVIFVPHLCKVTVPTGGTVDATVIEGPDGQPMAGPGVLPVSARVSHDERFGLRALAAIGLAAGLSLLGWSSTPGSADASTRIAWSDYVSSDFGD